LLANGGSGPNKERQDGPHAHAVEFDSSNRFLLAADLGIDRVLIYRFDAAKGTLTANDPGSLQLAPGAGPRHISFHPSSPLVFAINELNSTITTLSWDAKTGRLAAAGSVSTVPADYHDPGNTTAEIVVHPNGRVLYGSNRGHNSIAVFSIGSTGNLSLLQHQSTRGEWPRNFALSPDGRWLVAANQKSNSLAVFSVDSMGTLAPVGPLTPVGTPVCVLFVR
jgi:6-phosphogluconolactonase